MISVVTITYNNFTDLKETLASIGGLPGIESIVINGGTCEQSKELLASHPGVVVSEKDDGIADAFNKGVRRATGDAIALLNSGDVLIDRNYYAWADEALKKNPSLGFVYADLQFVDSSVGEFTMHPRALHGVNLGKGIPFPHPTMVVRREVFERVGLFSKEYKIAMDFDWVVRMTALEVRGEYYPHPTVRMDGAGVSSSRELVGIQECKRSLQAHGQFGAWARWGYCQRLLAYAVRTLAVRFLGKNGLKKLKKLKRTLTSPKASG